MAKPLFTKRHYEAIARCVWSDGAFTKSSLMLMFSHDNPNFNREKFDKACKLDPVEFAPDDLVTAFRILIDSRGVDTVTAALSAALLPRR